MKGFEGENDTFIYGEPQALCQGAPSKRGPIFEEELTPKV
jgi:hypothetical protein